MCPLYNPAWTLMDAVGGGVGKAAPTSPVQKIDQKMGNDPNSSAANFAQNQAYLVPGQHTYNTPLTPKEEAAFRSWLVGNNVPFQPDEKVTDYDMRGFWKALQSGDPRARNAIDPNDKKLHYPDYWKTPYHETFSNESQWADKKKAPKWTNDDKLVLPDGTVVFDDRAKRQEGKK